MKVVHLDHLLVSSFVGILLLLPVASCFVLTKNPSLSNINCGDWQKQKQHQQQHKNRRQKNLPLPMFGGLFGGGDDNKNNDGDLVVYSKLAQDDPVKFRSLSEYILEWSKLEMQLTTPVEVLPSEGRNGDAVGAEAEADGDVVACNGVRFVFQSTDTGYKSRKEEDETGGYRPPLTSSQQQGGDKKKTKKMEGGVEILVEQLQSGEIRVRARRCEMDEDTMIKEMSEDKILQELKQAITAWKG